MDSLPSPRLRGVTKRDLARIAELESEAFGENGLTVKVLDVIYDVSGGLWWLAEDDDGVWGYSINARGEEFGVGWIVGMAVHPDRQNSGWGKCLLDATIAGLHRYEMGTIRLLVSPANKIARRLYENYGFAHTGELIHHFGRNEDRILMTLLLDVPPQRPAVLPQVPLDSDEDHR